MWISVFFKLFEKTSMRTRNLWVNLFLQLELLHVYLNVEEF